MFDGIGLEDGGSDSRFRLSVGRTGGGGGAFSFYCTMRGRRGKNWLFLISENPSQTIASAGKLKFETLFSSAGRGL